MKLSKQRKAYVGVLGLGLAALVVDRSVGSSATSPSSAAAGVGMTIPTNESQELSARPTVGGQTVAERLEELRDRAAPESTPDAFARVQSWYESEREPAPAASEKPLSSVYRLSSVLTDRDGKALFAIVNGQKIALAEEVQGIRLVDAGGTKGGSPGFATIEVGGERIELRMKEAATRTDMKLQHRK